MVLGNPQLACSYYDELDGILEALNGDVAVVHAVDVAQENTGYDGSGVTGNH